MQENYCGLVVYTPGQKETNYSQNTRRIIYSS